MRVWTIAYNPFRFGPPNHAVATRLDRVKGPYDLGSGFAAYTVTAPNGKLFVVEKVSGGIVGSSLEEVRADIASGDPEVMRQQVEDNLRKGRMAEVVSADEFWRLLKCTAAEGKNE